MNKQDYYYDLPKELIAQTPIEPRDRSRLLHYNRKEDKIEHKHFYDVYDYLKKGDVLVLNNTKVIPARLHAKRKGFDGNVEVLLLKRLGLKKWECITKPARKLKVGVELVFADELEARVVAYREDGIREIEFIYDGVFEDIIAKIGEMPLPPYITEKLENPDRYQTVYSEHQGSAAAPTAGLHFTDELLERIKVKGVQVVNVLLHVGLGTFRPVKEEQIENHKLHSEYYQISEDACNIINAAKKEHRRVICVGTTSVRVLETVADESGFLKPCFGNTEIFIYPPYKFKAVDALITNFHLPESTLVMLVASLVGREKILEIYKEAIAERYRFFSFGDAMMIE